MALAAGTRLGPYEVHSLIGAGGMGEVYRARDTQLKRDVALKILPSDVALDAERLARFDREAQALAALNHPHIAQIYGFAHEGDARGIAMELVEGEDLAQRVARGAIPVAEALPLARQIADALEYAHERGIIHRDLKPANIKVTPDGTVKVLDFGLAKAFEIEPAADVADAATMTSPAMTRMGTILGTAAYMSPEQAKGRRVDKRADIWAFGCVFYELLTGRRPFAGDDVTDLIVSVMSKEPDWSALPADLPARLRDVLARCLRKDARQRLRDIGDARVEIDESIAGGLGDSAAGNSPSRPGRGVAWRVGFAGLVAGLLLGGAALGWWHQRARPTPSRPLAPVRATIDLPADAPLAIGVDIPTIGYNSPVVAVSPDGSRIVYVAKTATAHLLYVINVARDTPPTPLAGTEGAIHPFFSPDGQWVGFLTVGHVKKVPAHGGAVVPLCAARTPVLASWPEAGAIYFTEDETTTLSRVSADGGAAAEVLRLTQDATTFLISRVLPGARSVLADRGASIGADHHDLVVVDLATRSVKTVLRNGYAPNYIPPGYLLFGRAGTLMAVRFDLEKEEVVGREFPVAAGTAMESLFGQVHADSSQTGLAAYVPGGDMSIGRIAKVAAVAQGGGVEYLDVPEKVYGEVSLAPPDGRRLAVQVADVRDYVWVWDIERRQGQKVQGSEDEGWPEWSRDGTILATSRPGRGIVVREAGGTGPATPWPVDNPFAVPLGWAPSNDVLAVGLRYSPAGRVRRSSDCGTGPERGGMVRQLLARRAMALLLFNDNRHERGPHSLVPRGRRSRAAVLRGRRTGTALDAERQSLLPQGQRVAHGPRQHESAARLEDASAHRVPHGFRRHTRDVIRRLSRRAAPARR